FKHENATFSLYEFHEKALLHAKSFAILHRMGYRSFHNLVNLCQKTGKVMTGRNGIAFLCLWVLSVTMVTGQVHAKTEELKGFKDWMIYKQETAKGRICFMSSVPKELRGDYDRANRGETRVFVSHGPGKAERDVVSVLAGYRYKKQSEVDFSIDKKSATLFTLDNRAWSQGPEDDMRLVAAMKRGSKLIVTGVSSRNNKTIDEYSLSGFTAAKNFPG
ncbi:MAG: invasion associated locus B family protein, partial [Candidatus Puniceispirillaceae bacterium]